MKVFLFAVLLTCCTWIASGEEDELLHPPVAANHHRATNIYTSRRVIRDVSDLLFGTDASTNMNGTCDHQIGLLWSHEVHSSVFATPSIVDLHGDGRKEIIVATAAHTVEALDGMTGEDMSGWPFTHPKFQSHSGVVPVGLQRDGITQYMISTYNGQLAFLDEHGVGLVNRTIQIPQLRVPRYWVKEAMKNNKASPPPTEPDQVHHQKPHESLLKKRDVMVHEDKKHFPIEQQPLPQRHVDLKLEEDSMPPHHAPHDAQPQSPQGHEPLPPTMEPHNLGTHKKLQQLEEEQEEEEAGSYLDKDSDLHMDPNLDYREYYGLDDHDAMEEYYDPAIPEKVRLGEGTDGRLSDEALRSMDLVFHPELYHSVLRNVPHDEDVLEALPHANPVHQDPSGSVLDPTNSQYVLVDPHILATPVVTDLDFDGELEAIVPVSYFFDSQKYMSPNEVSKMPPDFNISEYAAGGIVVVCLRTGQIKWSKQLDLTTRTVDHPAYILASPTVGNIDADAYLDVIVVTSLGYIAIFDHLGIMKPRWPVAMGPIYSAPLLEDVDGDGTLDICAGDVHGNVACFDHHAKEMWHRQFAGSLGESLAAGDVNGDGFIDVVAVTTTGYVWAFDGRHGKIPAAHFPFSFHSTITTPPLLLNLNGSELNSGHNNHLGLHIIVVAHDGFMYVMSGRSGCYEKFDLGESSFSRVLADDLTGNGKMDLTVTTLSGGVHVFETETPYHPRKVWSEHFTCGTGMSAKEENVAVFFTEESRHLRDIRGDHFHILFTIEDHRVHSRLEHIRKHHLYYVTITVGRRVLLLSRLYADSGTYSVQLATPFERMYGELIITMRMPTGQCYHDSIALSFNMHFMETVRFLLVVPFLLCMFLLSRVKKEHEIPDIAYRPYSYGGSTGTGRSRRGRRYRSAHEVEAGEEDEYDVMEREVLTMFLLAERQQRLARQRHEQQQRKEDEAEA